jgi:hypothetical protein
MMIADRCRLSNVVGAEIVRSGMVGCRCLPGSAVMVEKLPTIRLMARALVTEQCAGMVSAERRRVSSTCMVRAHASASQEIRS